MCKTEVPDEKWQNKCSPQTISESDEDSWEADEHLTDNWGAMNLSKLSESDSVSDYSLFQLQIGSFHFVKYHFKFSV